MHILTRVGIYAMLGFGLSQIVVVTEGLWTRWQLIGPTIALGLLAIGLLRQRRGVRAETPPVPWRGIRYIGYEKDWHKWADQEFDDLTKQKKDEA
jgi:hypothetical protein